MKFKGLLDRASREPVLGFGAIGLGITAWWPALVDNDAKKAAVGGILLYLQRIFSTSKKSADENVANATADVDTKIETAKYVGAVEHQAVALGATILDARSRAGAAPNKS